MKKTIYIANAFSLSMLDRDAQSRGMQPFVFARGRLLRSRFPVPVNNPKKYLDNAKERGVEIMSILEHESTRGIFERALNHPCPVNRVNFNFRDHPDAILLVGQYVGPRLPEGAVNLPAGARIDWWTI